MGSRAHRVAFAAACLLSIAVVAFAVTSPALHAEALVVAVGLRRYSLALATSVAACAFVALRRYRGEGERRQAASWLASAPIGSRDLRLFLRRQAVQRTVATAGLVSAAIIVLGALSGIPLGDTGAILGASCLLGGAAGWRAGDRQPMEPVTTALPRLRRSTRLRVQSSGMGALHRWPFAQWLAAVDPRRHARTFAVVLLVLPMGIAWTVAVPLLLLIAVIAAAWGLSEALLATIPAAAAFFRSTPLPSRRWARCLCLRVFAVQCLAVVLAAALGGLLGASSIVALAGAVAWLAWTALAVLIGLARRWDSDASKAERAACAIALLTLAALAPSAAILAWAALVAWYGRQT